MTEPSRSADAVPADVPRFEVPSGLPDAPPDPAQASLRRAQRAYQTGWSQPWADDAIRDEAELVEAEQQWQPPSVSPARQGVRGLLRRRSRAAEADDQSESADPIAAQPRRMAPEVGVSQPQKLDADPRVGQSDAAG